MTGVFLLLVALSIWIALVGSTEALKLYYRFRNEKPKVAPLIDRIVPYLRKTEARVGRFVLVYLVLSLVLLFVALSVDVVLVALFALVLGPVSYVLVRVAVLLSRMD